MCGRFTLRTPAAEVARQFALAVVPELSPRYNIAPTQKVAIVRRREAAAPRELAMVRWGLIPRWAKDTKIGASMINARSETVDTKPAFKSAFKHRRCLVPADGFFEWRRQGAGKQPYYISGRDGRPLAIAALWETWQGESEAIESCTLLTTEANDLLRGLHDRMPVILSEEDYDRWLGLQADETSKLMPLLRPFPAERLQLYAVNVLVNNPRNDVPECLERDESAA